MATKMTFWVRIEGQEKRVDVEEQDGLYAVDVDGTSRVVDCRSAGSEDSLSLIIANKSYLIKTSLVQADEGLYTADVNGRRYGVEVLDERLLAVRRAADVVKQTGPYIVASPMPGLIVDVLVGVGDTVAAGSAVAIMEAMKMQNELVSEVDGVVTTVHVASKDTVDSQAPLIEIERSE